MAAALLAKLDQDSSQLTTEIRNQIVSIGNPNPDTEGVRADERDRIVAASLAKLNQDRQEQLARLKQVATPGTVQVLVKSRLSRSTGVGSGAEHLHLQPTTHTQTKPDSPLNDDVTRPGNDPSHIFIGKWDIHNPRWIRYILKG